MRSSEEGRDGRRMALYGAGFMLLNVAVIGTLYAAATRAGLSQTYTLSQETVTFLERTCDQYENYEQGALAQRLQEISGDAETFAAFLPESNVGLDDDLISEYVATEGLGGIVVADSSGNVLAQADSEGGDAAGLWSGVLAGDEAQGVLAHPQKTLADIYTTDGSTYGYAVVAYGDDLLLAYRRVEGGPQDPYSYTIAGLVSSHTFHRNPSVFIAQGDRVVSTNEQGGVQERSHYDELLDDDAEWSSEKLTKVDFDGKTWYGLRSSYKTYRYYLLYPEDEVFSNRRTNIIVGLIFYLGASVAILIVRALGSRRALKSTQKQLSIIDAISATYESTLLLRLDTMRLEPIKLSEKFRRVYAQTQGLDDFMTVAAHDLIAPESRDAVLALMDSQTLAERLEGKAYLSADARSISGKDWFSLQVIPQQRDAEGHLVSAIMATRDVTSAKMAEELSFRDGLTGLRNRNYLESHVEDFMDESRMPVSVVMADCNYLKRTNDTRGHKWGDELLRRVAAALADAAGRDDLVMRVGGDEFLIVCPRSGEAKAQALIERAKKRLERASDADLRLSVSFGSCTVSSPEVAFERVYAAADAAMYAEKVSAHREAKAAAKDL